MTAPLFLASALLVLDYFAKAYASQLFAGHLLLIPGLLRFEVVYNRNPWFGLMGQHGLGMRSIWILCTLLALLAFLALFRRATSQTQRFAFAFLSAGAAGNLLSWLKDGQVVDFIALPLLPIFNLADLWLACGVLTLLLHLRRPSREKPDVSNPL